MSFSILDLSNSSSWVRIHDTTLFAAPVLGQNGKHYPIPSYLIPEVVDRRILAVGASSSKAKPTWNLGFYLAMLVKVPGVGNAEVVSRPIRLGLNLVIFPPVSSEFTLKARIAKWHQEMSLTVWKYIGLETDVLSSLENIDSDLTCIEYKVDAIQAWGQP